MPNFMYDLLTLTPELILLVAALTVLMVATSKSANAFMLSRMLATVAIGLSVGALASMPGETALIFEGLMSQSPLAIFFKGLCDLLVLGVLALAWHHMPGARLDKPEFFALMLFALLGMHLMISANDLMVLYLGLEMQSLSLYVMVAFNRESPLATEAALKYFVLGALASVFILFGSSFIYGFVGSTEYSLITTAFSVAPQGLDMRVLYVGLALVLMGFAFKVSWAPFHLWTPDVYQGSPTIVTVFLAAAPKIAAFAVLIRLLMIVMHPYAAFWTDVVAGLAALSMVAGAFGALSQTSLKRLLAYSTISHMGYASLALLAPEAQSLYALMIYLIIYSLTTLAIFGLLLSFSRHGENIDTIEDLTGLAKTHPYVALSMTILLFSLAGIPPLAGFFAKFAVFQVAIQAGYVGIAILGILTSVVAAAYYLKIMKVMYFDEAATLVKLDLPFSRSTTAIMALGTLATLTYVLLPASFALILQQTAASLFMKG